MASSTAAAAATTPATQLNSTATEPVHLVSSTPLSLQRAVHHRRAEYTRPHRIRIKVGSWNVAACPDTDKDLASWFVHPTDETLATASVRPTDHRHDTIPPPLGGNKIGLYVLGLQEIIDLGTITYMSRVYAVDNTPMQKWRAALDAALPTGYQLVVCQQMTGLLLLVYASPELLPSISDVSTVSIGTGLMGYLGNKGAIATRLILGESTRLVFVNCHLASGSEASHLDRRIWDVGQIVARASFTPVVSGGVAEQGGNHMGDEDFAFWFGDLNFRLDGLPGDDIRRLLMLHTRGEYDLSRQAPEDEFDDAPPEDPVSASHTDLVTKARDDGHDSTDHSTDQDSTEPSPTGSSSDSSMDLPDPDDFEPDAHQDPLSLQATLDSLLPHDQLLRLIKERKLFHDGWREGPLAFLPSYKYDVGTVDQFDSSEKRRAPSWCDRILYRTRRDKQRFDKARQDEAEAKKRDTEMKAQGLDCASEEEQVLFDYDPDVDADVESDPDADADANTHANADALFDADNETSRQPRGTAGAAGLAYNDQDPADPSDTAHSVTNPDEGFVDRIQLHGYTSHQSITSSDHKPLTSVFTLEYDAVVPALKAHVLAQVARDLDRAENEGRPSITIVVDQDEDSTRMGGAHDIQEGHGDHVADLGEVRFLTETSLTVTLANTGRVPAVVSFVDKPTGEPTRGPTRDPPKQNGHGHAPPPWLSTHFVPSGSLDADGDAQDGGKPVTLDPGDTVQAAVTIRVDDIHHCRMLNDGHATLEDVLVLRVTDGRHHFIPVRAQWSPTCIGRSLDELIRAPDGGVKPFVHRLSATQGWAGGTGSISYDLPIQSAAPKELFKLTEAAVAWTERALADEQMLEESKIPRSAGWPFDPTLWKVQDAGARRAHMIQLLDSLDNDKPLADAFAPETSCLERLEVVCEALLLFLRALTDGVITAPLWARLEQAPLPSIGLGGPVPAQSAEEAAEDDKTAILDVLAAAPNHNIAFVFLTSTLARIIAELAPLTKTDTHRNRGAAPVTAGIAGLGRRSLTLARALGGGASLASPTAEAMEVMEQRRAKESRVAEIFGPVVCRAPRPDKEKDRRVLADRQRALIELFLRGKGDS